jgi:transcriptional regulator of arginine metabolism
MKARRQAVILALVDREALHSQDELRRRLHKRGFEATQATISRDINELGLVKRAGDGAYQRPGVDTTSPRTARTALERAAAEFLRRAERVQQLVVIRTGAGQAQPLALAIDRASSAKRSAPSPATTRFSSSHATSGVRRRSSGGSKGMWAVMVLGFGTWACPSSCFTDCEEGAKDDRLGPKDERRTRTG